MLRYLNTTMYNFYTYRTNNYYTRRMHGIVAESIVARGYYYMHGFCNLAGVVDPMHAHVGKEKHECDWTVR